MASQRIEISETLKTGGRQVPKRDMWLLCRLPSRIPLWVWLLPPGSWKAAGGSQTLSSKSTWDDLACSARAKAHPILIIFNSNSLPVPSQSTQPSSHPKTLVEGIAAYQLWWWERKPLQILFHHCKRPGARFLNPDTGWNRSRGWMEGWCPVTGAEVPPGFLPLGIGAFFHLVAPQSQTKAKRD